MLEFAVWTLCLLGPITAVVSGKTTKIEVVR